MKVVKRDGRKETVNLQKIVNRIKKQCYDLNTKFVDAHQVSIKVINGLYDGVTSKELDRLAAETAASMISVHPDYSILASRLELTALYKEVDKSFSNNIERLHKHINPKTGLNAGMISDEVYDIIMKNAEELDEAIIHDRDFNHDYFGFKTLERSYLLKINGKIAERIQHMWMRVSVGIWKDNIVEVLNTYNMMSEKWFTHATPTLFNSGTLKPQMSSCFLVAMADDSIRGIYKTLSDVALISQAAGGVGIHIHNVRGKDSYIKGTNGYSNGIVPMLRNFNETARYVDQGGGKRKGSFAIYLEPWHSDVLDFLDLRKNQGKEEIRCRDLFTALWMNDLFFERLENDGDWSLFSPDEAPNLVELYGDAFKKQYEAYEAAGKARKVIKAKDLMEKIIDAQIEGGTPYMMSKDACNLKSNQKNLGTIKSSNLCTEIVEYSDANETAVCNLASIVLHKCINEKGEFDHDKLFQVTYQVTKNLNQVIDVNYYPTPETETSNRKHRPIGIGIQGLADLFAILQLPFTSPEAKKLNKEIMETIYFAALTASCDLAKKHGAYASYEGSPISQGIFQQDMWTDRILGLGTDGKWKIVEEKPIEVSGRWKWDKLKERIKKYGVRNSLLLAPMPTASTSQIMGSNECFEPYTTNIYKRNTLSGEFVVLNKYMVYDLIKHDLWSDEMRKKIILNEGSIQNVIEIPQKIRDIYKTVWELKQRDLIDMAADRGAFIDQSQSFNLWIKDVTKSKVNSAITYGHKKGLKTINYYVRSTAAAAAIKGLGVDASEIKPVAMETPIATGVTLPEIANTAYATIPDSATVTPTVSFGELTDSELLGKVCSIDDPSCVACSS